MTLRKVTRNHRIFPPMRRSTRCSTWPCEILPRSGRCRSATGSRHGVALPLNLPDDFLNDQNLFPRVYERLESISSRQKEEKLNCSTRGGGRAEPLRSAQDATEARRVHLRLSQSSGWSVFFPVGAFWLMCGSAFHDDAHHAFMAPPPYNNRTREGETRQMGGVVRGGPLSYEMLSDSTDREKTRPSLCCKLYGVFVIR